MVSFWGRPPDPAAKINTLTCPLSEASPDRMGYLPVRNAALFGVQTESGVTSCLNRAPSSASRSMFGVLIVSLPEQPRSAFPRSSTRNTIMFGFADVRMNTKNVKIQLSQVLCIVAGDEKVYSSLHYFEHFTTLKSPSWICMPSHRGESRYVAFRYGHAIKEVKSRHW